MEDYDAWIIVGTGLDDDGIDKDIRKLKIKLKNEEEKLELKISAKEDAEADLQALLDNIEKVKEENQKNLEVLKETENEIKRLEEKSNAGGLNLGEASKLGRLENQVVDLQENYSKSNAELEKQNGLLNGAHNKVSQTTYEYGVQVRNVLELRKELEEAENVQKKFPNGINKIIKKVGRWALAVFGIRSAYMAIRQAMNVLSSVDEQLKTDLQYIRIAMATALEPIVKTIVEWALRLLQIIGAIVQKITGKNPFERVNENLKKANGSAKQLSKTLAGFDEMNVVGDNSSSGIGTPSIDITGNFELPTWMEKILAHKDEIVDFLLWLASMFLLLKLLSFAGTIGEISKAVRTLIPALETLSGLKLFGALAGIALTIVGIVETIKAIIDFIKDPSWDNFANILKGLAIALAGVAIAMIAVNVANPVAWILLAIAAFTALMALIIKNWDKIKAWFNKIGGIIQDKLINPIKNKFNALPNWFKSLIKTIVNNAIGAINGLISGLNSMLLPLRGTIVLLGKIMGKSWTLETISIPKIPYVRKGAIINQPNRGVDLGVAKGGESGHEGVVPLTDSQQMALLGAEIGKNVVINLTNILQMNGRQLNRELKTLQAEDNFAINR